MGSPLRGLRVLDLSRILAGPWCTMLLGDAGASVIKLERTITGDDTRSWGPPFIESKEAPSNSVSTYFLSVNRSKQSVAVDFKKVEGREICRRLATEWADVVVENFKVGTTKRLGLDYNTLRQENPGLIYCSITGFGTTGPLSSRPGYDVIISGMYGLMSITGEENGDPAKVGVAITDVLTGTLAHGGILAALHERNQTGLGQQVESSLMETQLASLVNIASSSLNAPPGTPPPKRRGTSHESIVPYQTFRCRHVTKKDEEDQYVVVGAGNNTQFKRLCRVIGLPELATDSRFSTNADRVEHRDELIPILKQKFLEKSREEWVEQIKDKGFPFGPVRTVPEAFQCEQAIHRGMTMDLDHPIAGKVTLPGSPLTYSGVLAKEQERHQGRKSYLPPPVLGEHTEDVLMNVLKISRDDIKRLESDGVIECWRKASSTPEEP